jgi:hypothetical protein
MPDIITDDTIGEAPSSPSTTSPQPAVLRRPSNFLRDANQSFTESRPPVGMFHAYGHYASAVPTLDDIQKGNFSHKGWSGPGQRRNSQAHRDTDHHVLHSHQMRKESRNEPKKQAIVDVEKVPTDLESQTATGSVVEITAHDPSVPYPNGYQFPPKHTKWKSTTIALRGFGNYVITPLGFIITIYSLNVVAWGGMLFLILCRATPAMTHPYVQLFFLQISKMMHSRSFPDRRPQLSEIQEIN